MRYFKFNGLTVSDDGFLMLTSFSGSDGGSVSRREAKYVDMDGVNYYDVQFNGRVVDVNGFFNCETQEQANEIKRQISRACNPKQTHELEYFNGSKSYFAEAMPDSAVAFTKITDMAYTFTIYFNLFHFYWLSEQKRQNLFEVVSNVPNYDTTQLKLPVVFSTINSPISIDNDGDVPCYPILNISNDGTHTFASGSKIEITNTENGQQMKIDYIPSVGETITVDMYNCSVKSSNGTNLINYVEALSDFIQLDLGTNLIEINGIDNGTPYELIGSIDYRFSYVGV